MKRFGVTLACGLLASSPLAFGEVDDATVNELRVQIAALTQRLNQLEASNKVTLEEFVEVKASAAKKSSGWTERFAMSGDFRFRYENIDDERRDKDRDRNRIRARTSITAKVTDDLKIGIGLASGGDDPTSTNQTLGGAASTKDFNLDLAFFDWKVLDNTHLIGGKFKNPHYRPEKHGLVWDGDVRPEGMTVNYDNGALFGYAGFNFLNSDSGSSGNNDTDEIYSLQVGYRTAISDAKLIVGGGYIYAPIEGALSYLDGECEPGDSNCFGNTLNPDGTFAFDYEELEGFAELQMSLADKPLVLFGNAVQNQDADDEDFGYAAGIRFGKAKNPGSWQVSYTYQDLEADAVFGMLTDSDFGGGGTDTSGHLFKAAYAIAKNTQLKATYFANQYGEHTRGKEYDYDRIQLDLSIKY